MKLLIVLFLSFFQLDFAFADDGLSLRLIEQQLQKMSKMNLVSPKPVIKHSFSSPLPQEKPAPLSCDVKLQSNRQEVVVDYSCDAIKTLKTEALSLAAN